MSDLESYVNQLAQQGGTRSLSHCVLAPFGVSSGFSVVVFSDGNLFFSPKSTAGIRSAFSMTFGPLTLVSLVAMKREFSKSIPVTQQGCDVDKKPLND